MDLEKNIKDNTKNGIKRYTSTYYSKGDSVRIFNRPYFKDVYLYLTQNKVPFHNAAISRMEILAERYILLDSLSFRLNITPGKAVLAIPESCVDRDITLCHNSILGDIKVLLRHIKLLLKIFSY